jgi:hypothetical protein
VSRDGLIRSETTEEVPDRNAADTVHDEMVWAAIDEYGRRFGVVVAEGPEAVEVFGTEGGGVLDLDGPEAGTPVDHEIYFDTRPRPPEWQRVIAGGAGDPRPQVLRDEPLQGAAVDLFGPIERAPWAQRSKDAHVEKVELGMDLPVPRGPSRKKL